MAVGRSRQGTNQEGALAPRRSAWGQLLEDSTPVFIDRPLPIGTGKHNFGGTAGGVFTLSASVIALVSQPGYFGDIPQSQQDVVQALPPWQRS